MPSKPNAIVTGASRGIGRAVALELAKTHNLIATYRGRLVRAVQARSDALAAQIAVLDEVMAADAAAIAGLPDAEAEEMRLWREVETLRKLSAAWPSRPG